MGTVADTEPAGRSPVIAMDGVTARQKIIDPAHVWLEIFGAVGIKAPHILDRELLVSLKLPDRGRGGRRARANWVLASQIAIVVEIHLFGDDINFDKFRESRGSDRLVGQGFGLSAKMQAAATEQIFGRG